MFLIDKIIDKVNKLPIYEYEKALLLISITIYTVIFIILLIIGVAGLFSYLF